MKSRDPAPIGVARRRQRRAQRQRVARLETLLLLLGHPRETFDHQPCPDQQRERQRDFGNDQRLAQALSPGAPAVAPAALLERFVEVGVGVLQRWNETENDAAHQRDHEGEDHHALIDADAFPSWNVLDLVERDESYDFSSIPAKYS